MNVSMWTFLKETNKFFAITALEQGEVMSIPPNLFKTKTFFGSFHIWVENAIAEYRKTLFSIIWFFRCRKFDPRSNQSFFCVLASGDVYWCVYVLSSWRWYEFSPSTKRYHLTGRTQITRISFDFSSLGYECNSNAFNTDFLVHENLGATKNVH